MEETKAALARLNGRLFREIPLVTASAETRTLIDFSRQSVATWPIFRRIPASAAAIDPSLSPADPSIIYSRSFSLFARLLSRGGRETAELKLDLAVI